MADLLACNASRRWARLVAGGRPYRTVDELIEASGHILTSLGWEDVAEALDAHPRIGERAAGSGQESTWSRREQSGARAASPEVARALAEGNRAYVERFGHVFLICATGLTADEMLADVTRRLTHDAATERTVTGQELAKITALRLGKLMAAGISLATNSYGKSEVRLVRVARDGARHDITDLNVSVALAGDLDATHLTGDNADVLPTDTQKNTVYAFAREYGVGEARLCA